MNVFFAEIREHEAFLNEEESWHCVKVLRRKEQDEVVVIDGKGTRAVGRITQAHPKQCVVAVSEKQFFEPTRSYRLHLAIAPTKNIDRIEWLIEKAVEIGIDEISFLKCHNSERTVIKTDRIQKIIDSAVKQSLQYYMPALHGLTDFNAFVSNDAAQVRLIAHCDEDNKQHLKAHCKPGQAYSILIGPEGDFSQAEIGLAKQKGYLPVSLGESRLRTETAGLYACACFAVVA